MEAHTPAREDDKQNQAWYRDSLYRAFSKSVARNTGTKEQYLVPTQNIETMPEQIEPVEDLYDFELSKEDFEQVVVELLKEDARKDETA